MKHPANWNIHFKAELSVKRKTKKKNWWFVMVGMIHSWPCPAADWRSVQRVPCLSLYDSWDRLQPQNWVSGKKNGCTDGWMGWFMSMHMYKPYRKQITCPGLTPFSLWQLGHAPATPKSWIGKAGNERMAFWYTNKSILGVTFQHSSLDWAANVPLK